MRSTLASRRTLVALVLLIAGAQPADAGAEAAPPCLAEASFDVDRATLGQQVIYRVRVLRRDDVAEVAWVSAPVFPGFRAEWLSEQPDPVPLRRGGARYHAREERRALFPQRLGRLRVEPPKLRCQVGSGTQQRTRSVDVPAAVLQSSDAPRAGRPENWEGLIGPVSLQALVTPQEIFLGESVRVAVMLRGGGNLWNAADPLETVVGADVFRRRPELTVEAGERLVVKRHFAYDVVPLAEGVLVIPTVRVVFFDPVTASFGSASAPAASVRVGPRSAAATTTRGPAEPNASAAAKPAPAESTEAADGRRSPLLAAAAALIAVAFGAVAAHRRRRTRLALATFDASVMDCADPADEAAACARALRTALARHLSGTRSLTAEEIARHPELPQQAAAAARLLAEVERGRFDPAAALPGRDRVRRALAAL